MGVWAQRLLTLLHVNKLPGGHEKVLGTLIVPQWPSVPFRSMLFPNRTHPASFVLEIQELPRLEYLFIPGHSGYMLLKGIINKMVCA